jgi:hypothetical protein
MSVVMGLPDEGVGLDYYELRAGTHNRVLAPDPFFVDVTP